MSSMSFKKVAVVAFVPVAAVAILVLSRLLPHVPNFAPITAMALFGGAYLSKKYALLLPLVAMAISDYLLLYVHPFSAHPLSFTHVYGPLAGFTSASWAVYASFALSGGVGLWLRERKSVTNIFLASIFCSLQFFLITNAAVWLGGAYERSIIGLWESYVAGLPFLRGTVLGDVFYTGLFFGAFEYFRALSREKVRVLAS